MKLFSLFSSPKTKQVAVSEPPRPTIVIDGKVIFTIYKNGNGYYSAKHYSTFLGESNWLESNWREVGPRVVMFQTEDLEELERACAYYIRHTSLVKVGEIKFIPT